MSRGSESMKRIGGSIDPCRLLCVIALVAVFGISWMADSMFAVHTPMISAALKGVVTDYPWTYAVMLLWRSTN